MNPPLSLKRLSKLARFSIALLAAIPFVLLQLAFLSDSFNWAVFLFGYMGIVIAASIVFLGWCAYCFAEYRVRLTTTNRPVPSFAIAGGVLLLAFFLPAIVVNSIALRIPYFCRVIQSIEWSTSKPNAEWKTNHSFILVLIGKGTQENHRFTTGYMNWTGSEPAGFASVDFEPVSFQEQYYERNKSGTLDYLKSRMANSGIPDDELETVSEGVIPCHPWFCGGFG